MEGSSSARQKVTTTIEQMMRRPAKQWIIHVGVLFVSLMFHGIVRGLFVHQSSNKISVVKVRIDPCFPCCRHGRSQVSFTG
jgi:hypothetical protein